MKYLECVSIIGYAQCGKRDEATLYLHYKYHYKLSFPSKFQCSAFEYE